MKYQIACLTTALGVSTLGSLAVAQDSKPSVLKKKALKEVDTQVFIFDENIWETSISDFKKQHEDFAFEWMSSAKDRIRSEGKNVSTLGNESGELLVISSSDSDKVRGITIMFFNKGDDGEIPLSKFNGIFTKVSDKITAETGDRPEDKSTNGTVEITKTFWKKGDTAFQLEKSVNAETHQPEFMRLRIASVKAARRGGSTATRSSLRSNVVEDRDSGDVYISNVPMIDQGKKGYCACASAARIYQYYGQQTDQHEMAQIAGSTAAGTALNEMVAALKKVTNELNSRVLVLHEYPDGLADLPTEKDGDDYRAWSRANKKLEGGLKEMTRDVNNYQRLAEKAGKKVVHINGMEDNRIPRGSYLPSGSVDYFKENCDGELFRQVMMKKSSYKRFLSKIEQYIDQGIPVGWCLQLGMFPEPGLPQASGGHMRLIIGYNEETEEIIYSDSWGKGHGQKKMDAGKAFCMTSAILVMPPTR